MSRAKGSPGGDGHRSEMDEGRPHGKFFEKALTAAGEWTRFTDPKLLGVLVLLGLGVANLISRAGKLWSAHEDASCWGWIATGSFVTAAILAVLVVVFVSLGLFPQTEKRAGSRKSLLFFGDIASFKTPEAYEKEVRSKTEQELESEVAHQAWEVARVAVRKYRWAKLAFYFVVAFLGAWVLARVALSIAG